MAKNTPAVEKRPNIFKQISQLMSFTREIYPWAPWLVIGVLVLGLGLGILLGFLIPGGIFSKVLWGITGLTLGILAAIITLSRLATSAMYKKIDGTPGATGHVLSTSLGRAWQASDTPVDINAKTHDAVYRAIGRGGIVVVGEGSRARLKPMIAKEEKRDKRIASGVPITVLYVGNEEGDVPLSKLPKTIKKLPKAIDKTTRTAVINRAASVNAGGVSALPIPKGIDPNRVRAGRPR